MTLNIAIQMDPPQSLNYTKDSTYMLGLEAQKRGHSLYYYHADSLKLHNKTVKADISPLTFSSNLNDPFTLEGSKETNLTTFDIILMRNDFVDPLSYNAMTHILDHIKDQTLILNDPTGVRESPEKILITHYPELAPPTLVSRQLSDIKAFAREYGDLIIKPMNGFGGLDIYHARQGDDNLQAVYEMLTRAHSEPLIIQQYIPAVKEGDKRIIVVNGEPIAALLRVPQADSARANLAAGGTAKIGEITEREREICATLKPELIKRGLVFIGLDVIGNVVTEINPKSPTGLQQIKKLGDFDCAPIIWDAFEEKMDALHG